VGQQRAADPVRTAGNENRNALLRAFRAIRLIVFAAEESRNGTPPNMMAGMGAIMISIRHVGPALRRILPQCADDSRLGPQPVNNRE
jgi:hypothetical protein